MSGEREWLTGQPTTGFIGFEGGRVSCAQPAMVTQGLQKRQERQAKRGKIIAVNMVEQMRAQRFSW